MIDLAKANRLIQDGNRKVHADRARRGYPTGDPRVDEERAATRQTLVELTRQDWASSRANTTAVLGASRSFEAAKARGDRRGMVAAQDQMQALLRQRKGESRAVAAAKHGVIQGFQRKTGRYYGARSETRRR